MEGIKVGDIVTLKSDDSAVFTVGYISGDNKIVSLYWFDHNSTTIKAIDVPINIIKK